MKDPTGPRPEESVHFKLQFDKDAYGFTVGFRGQHGYPKVHLLQPFNARAEEHYSQDNDLNQLLIMLEMAYNKGYDEAKREIRKVLGVKNG